MEFKRFPTGFVIPAQPVAASRPPSGPDWSTNIKHDGYRRPDREAARDRVGYGADRGQELHDRRRGGRLGVLIVGNPSTSCAAGGHGHLLYSTPSHLIEHDGEELRDLPFLDRQGRVVAAVAQHR